MDWHRDNISDKKNYIKNTVISWGLEIKKQNKTGVGTVRRRKIQEEITEEDSQNFKLSGDNCEE